MIGDGIRSLSERAKEIAGRFGVEWNIIIFGNMGSNVEKFVREGIEKLRGRRRRAEDYEGTVKRDVGIGESSVGGGLRHKKAGIFKGLRMTAERLKMSADNVNLEWRNIVEYLHRPIVGMEVDKL